MPIQMTTPLDAGDMSPDVYDYIKITRQVHDARRLNIMLDLEYGTVIDGLFIAGSVSPSGETYPTHVTISDADYITMVTTHISNDGELTYEAVKRGLYEYLQTNYPALAGTVV